MQATATQAAPAQPGQPLVPAVPPAPRPASIAIVGADGTTQYLPVPLTARDVADIKARRSELSDQLISANSRRRRLASELAAQPVGPARAGIEGRLAVLDTRLAQLETDIAATGRQLSAAPRGLLSSETQDSGEDMSDNAVAISSVFTVFVLFPIAFAYARNMWRRGTKAAVGPAQLSAETSQRLERLEQGVDAIAIEIERVAEGQRFVTRLLSEGQVPARVGQGANAGEGIHAHRDTR